MLQHTRAFRLVTAKPSALRYYVPFAERPCYTLSVETVRALEEAAIANPAKTTLNEARVRLAAAILPRLGEQIYLPSPHLWPGTVARGVAMTSPLFCTLDPELAFLFAVAQLGTYLMWALFYYDQQPFCYLRIMALSAR